MSCPRVATPAANSSRAAAAQPVPLTQPLPADAIRALFLPWTHLMTLVFVHGSGGSAESFHYQLAAFPGSRAVTLPGHPDGDLLPSIALCADWLHAEITRMGLADVVLAGHSLGGGIALRYALDHPGQLRGLLLLGSGARLKVHPRYLEPLEAAVADPTRWNAAGGGFERIDPALAAVLNRRRIENGPRAMLNDMRACNDFDVMAEIGNIKLPTLALVGSEDVMTPPKYATFLAAGMPNCRVEVIDGASHYGFAEQPDAFNTAIERFVSSLTAAQLPAGHRA